MGISKEFIVAGNSTFTIEIPVEHQTGKPHLTYKVSVVEANGRWDEAIFVKLFVGTENNNYKHYQYLGKMDEATGQVNATAKSCRKQDSYELRLLNKVLAAIWAAQPETFEQHGFKTHHEGRCGCCNKKLTTPQSCETGIGPVCAGRMAMA